MKRFYVTTPIYYVNDVPHIGHTYTTVVADVLARYRRLMGRRVYFLTDTDEHGQHVERAAQKQGIPPIQLADRVVERYHQIWKRMQITHDDFIRTTEDRHRRGVYRIFDRVRRNDDIYLGEYEGMYCTGCEAFYPETQIVDGRCPDLGHPVEPLREASYFFRLSRYQEPLLAFYRDHPDFVRPDFRFNEVRRFVEMGLKDLSISRTSFRWGIPFPGDDRHILYVWFDALCNYVTALGYGDDAPLYGECWPADVHLVGKDILRFHAVYWPAFLMSAGLPLPKMVFAHGWWLRSNAKMSKSVGNIVDPVPLMDDFGPDAVRYFLMRDMAMGQDASFSEEALVDRINTDLANDFGNLASRLLRMIGSYRDGRIPSAAGAGDGALREAAAAATAAWREAFDDMRFHDGLAAIWTLVGEANRYIVRHEPWTLAKDPGRRGQLDTVLYEAAEALRLAAVTTLPVMPSASRTLLAQLGCPEEADATGPEVLDWGRLLAGATCRPGEALFPRVDKKAYFANITSPGASSGGAKPEEKTMEQSPGGAAGAGPSDTITIDDFLKVKLRVGRILEAEKLAGADKLLKLLVDLGDEKRTVLAGIALQYAPESLVGKSCVIVANLAPRAIRGVTSQGMLLAADEGGRPIVATFESEVTPGTTVR